MFAVTSIAILLVGGQGHAATDPKTPANPEKAKVGDPASPLEGLKFVKGAPVSIQYGKVYLVEFWATWCAPCVKSIPHLTKIQEKYKDRDVTVIGISSEDNLAKVKDFVSKLGKKMDYTVAVDVGRKVHAGYMRAYGLRGIPAAFLVDQKGKVVWVGHPQYGGMDEVLDMLVADTFDLKTYTQAQEEKRAAALVAGEITREYFKSLRSEVPIEQSRQIAEKLFKLDNPQVLVELAWDIFDSEDSDSIKCDYELALRAARKANADTEDKDPSMLEIYAKALAKTGKLKEAIVVQQKALSLVTGDETTRKSFEKQLAIYQKELIKSE